MKEKEKKEEKFIWYVVRATLTCENKDKYS